MKNLPGFLGGSYPAQSRNANYQRTINLVPTQTGTPGADGKVPLMLVGAPGFELWTIVSDQTIRGAHVIENTLYIVSGQVLYSIRNNKVKTVLGNLETTVGRVWMEHNNNHQLGIVDGKKIYIYNTETDVFSTPNPQPVAAPTSLAFIDQYFVVSLANSFFFQISQVNEGTVWPPTQLGAAEASPDNLLVVWNLHRQLYLLGAQTTEVWFNAGTSPFPFQTTSGVIDWGVLAPDSVAQAADTLVWLGLHKDGGLSGSVLATSGLTANVISTPGLEARWRSYPTTRDAIGFTYRVDGNDCYAITFPSGNETFVYDFSTDLWHERESYEVGAWVIQSSVRFVSKQLVMDRRKGTIYSLSPDIHNEDGEPLVSRRICSHYWNDRERFIIHAIEVELEAGVP